MNSHGLEDKPSSSLSYIPWETNPSIDLAGFSVRASGDAHPQVRSPDKLAQLGTLEAQILHMQQVIVQSLRDILLAMEAPGEHLKDLRSEIASATLVSANMKLATYGVILLDLSVRQLAVEAGS